MQTILVLGAGRSSASLISYLLEQARSYQWKIIVGDFSLAAAEQKVIGNELGQAIRFDIHDQDTSVKAISSADIVISLLPANLHPLVARHCLAFKKHLVTASYVSDEMMAFHQEALAKGLMFLNECGLDPGIDHMSALQVIDRIRGEGGKLTSFESFTGGLIAPETDPENPWRYKFTWNPRNVVMAGQGTAKFLQNGRYKYIPYQQLFKRTTPVFIHGLGDYEGYANRDSLKYIDTYKLHGIKTMLRGTLRNKGYCDAWNVFVQLGCCDDSYTMEGVRNMTHHEFIDSFLPEQTGNSAEEKICATFGFTSGSTETQKLRWLNLFTQESIGLEDGTPAQILEHILNKKWKLSPDDKDQIVMWHRFIYDLNGREKEIHASLVATGNNAVNTAMAKTVGLPLGIAAKLLLQNKIRAKGVAIPTSAEIYEPVLAELRTLGIELNEVQTR